MQERFRTTVLIVEDEPSVLNVRAASLLQAGYDILTAPGSREALELSRSHQGPIDLLLADVVMPGMNGAELADWLVAERPGLRVLCIAGMQYTPVVKGLIDQGRAFLPKPFLPYELVGKVAEVLGRPAVRRAGAP